MNFVASHIATVTNASFSRLSRSKNQGSPDFDMILSKSKSNQVMKNESFSEEKPVQKAKQQPQVQESKSVQEASQKDVEKKEPKDVEVNGPKDVANSEDSKPVKELTEEEKKVLKAIEEFVEDMAEDLGISVEDLNNMMAMLNITVLDLFQPEQLKSFMVEALGFTEDIELLTDENGSNAYKMLMEGLHDLADQLGLEPNSKDFKDLLQKIAGLSLESNSQPANEQNRVQEVIVDTPTVEPKSQNVEITVEDLTTKDATGPEIVTSKADTNQNNNASANSNQNFTNFFTNQLNQVQAKVNPIEQLNMPQIPAKEIFDQIVTGAKVLMTDKATTMFVQLTPEHLGKVAFSMASENGVISGHFVAENQTVKEAIEMNLATLKANLVEQGIKVDEIKVVIGNTNQFFEKNDQHQNFQDQSKNKRKKISIESIEEIEAKLQSMEETMRSLGLEETHAVEYSA